MGKETIEALIEGGKATAAPPLGPALGPLGVNIGTVVAEINKKTESLKGMQVPVKVIIDTDTKEFLIEIGTPPVSQLIKKEARIEKGSSNPNTDYVADLKIEQITKIAKMKEDFLLGTTLKEKVKEIVGTSQSMGVLIEGKKAQEALKEINEGKYNQKIKEEKTELTAEELQQLEEEKKKLHEEIKARRDEFIEKANKIIKSMEGEDKKNIKIKLTEAEIPIEIINELLPEEEKKPAQPPTESVQKKEPES